MNEDGNKNSQPNAGHSTQGKIFIGAVIGVLCGMATSVGLWFLLGITITMGIVSSVAGAFIGEKIVRSKEGAWGGAILAGLFIPGLFVFWGFVLCNLCN